MKGGSFVRGGFVKRRNERTEGAPHFPIVVLQRNHALEVIDRLGVCDYISTKRMIGRESSDRGG
jgi:hypothetical protein